MHSTRTTTACTTSTVTPVLTNNTTDRVEQELIIDQKARDILSSTLSEEQKQQALIELRTKRSILIEHVPVNKLKGSVIFFNMQQIGLAPTPLCPSYNKMCVPTFSTYGNISSNIGIIRLDPVALKHVPIQILEKVGDLSQKKVDLFWTAIDGRYCYNIHVSENDRPFNLVTHTWAHPHSLFGDDIPFDVDMGIFPEVGFQPSNKPGNIAFHHMSPMQVIAHINPEEDPDVMAFSPDNAHFEPIPGSPFGVCWCVAQKDGRVLITKMLVIFDYDHPICEMIVDSTRNCHDLDVHLNRLGKVNGAIERTFQNVIIAFDFDSENAMDLFHKLPLTFQNGIYKHAWIQKGSPMGVHGDFGRASFEKDPSLDAQYHCSNVDCALAIENYASELSQLLYFSQVDLTLNSQTLVKPANACELMRCAQFVKNAIEEIAMETFNALSEQQKQAVYLAIWELSKCPRGNANFGEHAFRDPNTPIDLKVEALLLAATRLQ